MLLHSDTCNIKMEKAATLIRDLTDSCCSVCSLVLQSLMVQSKEDVRNRWERSTLEGGRRGVRKRGREGEGEGRERGEEERKWEGGKEGEKEEREREGKEEEEEGEGRS